jgi:phosphomannomutase
LRKSNTEPIIRIIAEAPDQVRARELAEKIISDIKAVSQA